MPAVLYAADVVCPLVGPPLADGAVLVDGGTIVAVGAAEALAPAAQRTYRVDGVLLPGLVAGRTHVESTDAAASVPPAPLHRWAAALRATTAAWPEQRWGRSAHRGVLALLRAGVTAAGDVVTRGAGVPAACRAGLAGDSLVDVGGVDVETADEVLTAVEHALTLPADGRRVGIAPRSTTSLGAGVLQALAALAKRSDAPLQLCAATTPAEAAALRDGSGPLAERARARGYGFEWLDGGAGTTPVRYLDDLGALLPGATLAGGVRIDDGEARLLAARGVTVVCTPRADAALHVGDAPLERYAAAGTPLALGLGSAAAVPSLDVLAEAAAWARLAAQRGLSAWPSNTGPAPLAEAAVRLATGDGAAALGWGQHCGVLAPGRPADLVVVALDTSPATVYRDLVERGAGRQVLTVLAGVRKARRASPDEPWPPLDDDAERT